MLAEKEIGGTLSAGEAPGETCIEIDMVTATSAEIAEELARLALETADRGD